VRCVIPDELRQYVADVARRTHHADATVPERHATIAQCRAECLECEAGR